MTRAALDTSTLLRIALLLVVVLFVLWLLRAVLRLTTWFVFEILPALLVLAVVALVILWFIDRR